MLCRQEVVKPYRSFSSFLVRQATRNGLEKSLEWLATKGVDVMRPQQIVDVSFGGGKSITGLELSGEKQGLFRLEQIVWMLTSEETYFLNERLGKYFFPEGPLEPEWSWVRYRVGLHSCFERDHLPSHTLVVDDLDSPWSHENMMVLQRTTLPDQFDAWMRVPTVQRFNKEYLTVRSQRMRQHLLERMSLSDPQVLSFPQEYYYTYAQLGATRFPVFAARHDSRRGKVLYSNLHLDGPEEWPHYSWGAYFERHELILNQLINWWKEKLLKEQKDKEKGTSSVIERYTRPEMGLLWHADQRFGKMMEVEIAVAQVQAAMGIIPRSAAKSITQKARFNVKRIAEIEKETKHDVIAFVSNLAENVGPHGKFIHYGLTSSDVLDTAFSLQVRDAGMVILKSIEVLKKSLASLMKKHAETLCAGRTHGMFAEPTTFGFKMAGFLAETERNSFTRKNRSR